MYVSHISPLSLPLSLLLHATYYSDRKSIPSPLLLFPLTPPQKMTLAINDEIRSSSALAEKMNDTFDGTRVRLRGTMNRMLVMAERTGVGWRAWLLFFLGVAGVFWWVWL